MNSKNINKVFVINAAGGNATAIMLLKEPLSREEYAKIGKRMMNDFESFQVEQAGFLLLDTMHFEMSGGEFCGNAARAAAMLFFDLRQSNKFTMSGFLGEIVSRVKYTSTDKKIAEVSCDFPSLNPVPQLTDIKNTKIVDLGGIVHIVVNDNFPKEDYQQIHTKLTERFNLQNKAAVGVVWYNISGNDARIDPVVWVKDIDSFFYETSCGSGSIAVASVSGAENIFQPSGEKIIVKINNEGVNLKSDMEVIYESDD
ncbi:MAG: hypothetical protein K9M44_01070 [Candidatus Pacebacteria bacterium]|nr:hypothetical protein [Candidatus Paceibacterota bacterium]